MIKARFTCNAIVPNQYMPEATATLYFNAVYSKEGENADYSHATPYGQLSMGVDMGTKAATFFEIGKDYYLHFEPVVPRTSL